MLPDKHTAFIKQEALKLGFDSCGIAKALQLDEDARRLEVWLSKGYHGEMHYMEKRQEERADPARLLAGLHTIISAAISYNYSVKYRDGFPKISKYALVDDYHTVVRSKLEELLATIKILVGEPLTALITVDSSPLLEKHWAEEAGIGNIGKNTLLKVPSAGSYLFLGEILIDKEIASTKIPLPDYCGSCNSCLEHCPTGALVEPGKMDASRCISYLTVELKREFTTEEAVMIGDWIFGCDLCQECCPYNQQASIAAHESFRLRHDLMNLSMESILNLTRSGFRNLFYGTPVFRLGLRRLKRNARAVADNMKKAGTAGHITD